VPLGPKQQLSERRTGPGGYHVGLGGRHRLYSTDDDFWLLCQGHTSPSLAQERSFPSIGLDQHDIEVGPQRRHDQAGETGAGSEVGQLPGLRRQVRHDLRRIEDMAHPDVVDRRRTDQVDRLLPLQEDFDIGLELPPCFT